MGLYKERIVCLTEETTESLYLMGLEDLIVGVSSHTVRPPEARKKPKVSTFVKAKTEEILDLKPDLVIGFSDIQAEIAKELIKEGLEVLVLNYRSVEKILGMIRMLAAITGFPEKGEALVQRLETQIEEHRYKGDVRPKVYFEEWLDPIITGIEWVSEIIEIAGGQDVFAKLSKEPLAKDRIIKARSVKEKNPDLMLMSWCGKAFNPKKLKTRDGWDEIEAMKNGQVHELHSSIILQPGPACILEGLPKIRSLIDPLR